jgi:NADH-quinone oxidoreductase subunit L
LFLTFHGAFRGTEEQGSHVHESPGAMTIPLIILAILSIIGGFIGIPEVFMQNADRLGEFLSPVIAPVQHTIEHSTEYILMALTTVLAVVAIIIAWYLYKNYQERSTGAFGRVLQNKWYVDELYDSTIVQPVYKLGHIFNRYIERSGIDAIVNGVGRLVNYGGRQMRWLQSGLIGNYILLMVLSMVLFFVLQFFVRR